MVGEWEVMVIEFELFVEEAPVAIPVNAKVVSVGLGRAWVTGEEAGEAASGRKAARL